LEVKFHRAVAELSANRELIRVLGNVKAVYLTLFPQAILPAIRVRRSPTEITHADIACAIASGDPKKAHQVMWDHFAAPLRDFHKDFAEEGDEKHKTT
jgi:DNA-binding FadR family transcriptional regulator